MAFFKSEPTIDLVESERAKRIRSFLIGGVVGSAAGLVAAGRMIPSWGESARSARGSSFSFACFTPLLKAR